MVLDQPTGDRVAVCRASAVHVDVRLDRQSLAGLEAVAELFADLDDGHRCLVAEPCGFLGEVSAIELRVFAPKPEQLDVGEAQPDGVDPDEELIGARPRHVDGLRPAVAADVVDARSVDVPGERG